MNDRNRVPLVLMAFGLAGVVALAGWKLSGLRGPELAIGVTIVLGYLGWLLAERRISLTEASKGTTGRDRGSCELYAGARMLTVLLALGLPTQPAGLGLHTALGVCLFAFGVGFRLHAIRTLGDFYSHRVRLVDTHRVVDSGPYRVVRHPAYTGMLLAHAGFVLCFPNPWAAAALLVLLVPAVVRRISIEEVALFELAGYADYARTHKRLLPRVW